MASRKYLLVGAFILIFVGVSVVYYLLQREMKQVREQVIEDKNSKSDTITGSNRVLAPDEMGIKPEINPKSGSVTIVEEFIKASVKNPETYEFFEWSEVTAESGYWKVRCKYKGVSSFNAEVTTNAWFYIRNNKVMYTKIISKI